MSADCRFGGDRREMEDDHSVLAGGVAKTFRGHSAGNVRHLAKGPDTAAPRAGERRLSSAASDRKGPGAGRIFADRLWEIGLAVD